MREKSTADRKNSKCKGPGACAGTCLASFAGLQAVRKPVSEDQGGARRMK